MSQPSSPSDPASSQQHLARMASVVAVLTASLLAFIKIAAWFLSDSIAVLSSVIDSALDASTSLLVLFAIRYAERPADAKHRYGHAKAEAVSAVIQGTLVMGSGGIVAIEAIRRLHSPNELTSNPWVIGLMTASILLTMLLSAFQYSVARRTGSQAIRADSLHYRADIVMNSLVLVMLIAVGNGASLWFDGLLALGIVGYLAYSGLKIMHPALRELMDQEIPQRQRRTIGDTVKAHPHVVDFHDLRTREAGPNLFIEMHVELEGNMALEDVHQVTDELETAVAEKFPRARLTIHPEPAGVDDPRDKFTGQAS